MRHKIRLELQWLGTRYSGWQAQPNVSGPPSLFEVVHAALKQATGQDGGPVVAGRTDKGVHAMRQLATVTVRGPPRDGEGEAAAAERRRALDALVPQLNALLPSDVRVLHVADAPPSAHALADASRKTYSYFLLAGPLGTAERCAAWAVGCWLLPKSVDVQAMARAAAALPGHHDFRSFTSTQDPRCDTHRTLHAVRIAPCEHYAFPLLGCFCADQPAAPLPLGACPRCSSTEPPDGDAPTAAPAAPPETRPPPPAQQLAQLVQLQFVGAGFLKHQVRRLVGLLVRIGLGEEAEADGTAAVRAALADAASFDRRRAPTAPAQGLWLESVE